MLRYKASNHPEIEMKFHNKIRNAKSPRFLNMGLEIKLNTLRNKAHEKNFRELLENTDICKMYQCLY